MAKNSRTVHNAFPVGFGSISLPKNLIKGKPLRGGCVAPSGSESTNSPQGHNCVRSNSLHITAHSFVHFSPDSPIQFAVSYYFNLLHYNGQTEVHHPAGAGRPPGTGGKRTRSKIKWRKRPLQSENTAFNARRKPSPGHSEEGLCRVGNGPRWIIRPVWMIEMHTIRKGRTNTCFSLCLGTLKAR